MIRNLLYHLTPIGDYEWNLSQLEKRLHLFNGRKIIIVALTPEQYLEAEGKLPMEDFPANIITYINNSELRETATLKILLTDLYLHRTDPNEITFYAHSKGVTLQDHAAVRLWTEAMHYFNLDCIDRVEELLKEYPIVGAFKRYGRHPHDRESRWHYSGTFWWFRNKDLFERDWTNIPMHRYGTEVYLSKLFTQKEAGVVFGDNVRSLYHLAYTRRLLGKYKKRIEEACQLP